MVKKKGNRLGKGLEALFGDDVVNGTSVVAKKATVPEENTESSEKNTEDNTEENRAGKTLSNGSRKNLRSKSTGSAVTEFEVEGLENAESENAESEAVGIETTSSREESDKKKTAATNQKTSAADLREEELGGEVMVRLSLIEPNSSQPRKQFEEEKLEELSRSIKKYGVLQPLIVKKSGKGYEIIAGERRFRAAHAAGLREVPVIIREYDRQQSMEIAIIENIQRADLNPIEEARAYQTLIEEYDLKQEEVAERVSKNRSTVTNMLRLLRLEETIQEYLIEGRLSSGHARALLSVDNKEIQKKIADEIIQKNLSVRETEKLVKAQILPRKKRIEPLSQEEGRDYSIFYKEYEEKIRSIMGTGVRINRKDKNKGRIEIEYYSSAELERIMELFSGIRQ